MAKLKSLCETCQYQGEKCNIPNTQVKKVMIECKGYTMRDYVQPTDFIEEN